MNKTIVSIGALLLILAGCTNTNSASIEDTKVDTGEMHNSDSVGLDENQPSPDWQKHTNTLGKFEIKYPGDWQNELLPPSEYGESAGFSTFRMRSPDFLISTDELEMISQGVEIDTYVIGDVSGDIKKIFEEDTLLQQIATNLIDREIGNSPAIQYQWSYENSQAISTEWLADGRHYSIVMRYSDDAALEKYRQIYEQVLTSFELLGNE